MTTEELLNEMEREAELHSEETPVCVIDPETRTITVPPEYQLLGVESDEKVERLYFQCPKIVGDNVDLSQLILFINYQNAGQEIDAYKITDVETDGNNITFSWLLDRKVTAYRTTQQNKLGFSFCAQKQMRTEHLRKSGIRPLIRNAVSLKDWKPKNILRKKILPLLHRYGKPLTS